MLLLSLFKLLLIYLLSLLVIEFAKNRVILMCFPIFIESCLLLFLLLIFNTLLVILVINSCNNIKLFWIVLNQCFLSLNRQFQVTILEVKIRQFCIVYNIVSISNWTKLLTISLWLWSFFLARVKVYNVVWPLIFFSLSLNIKLKLQYDSLMIQLCRIDLISFCAVT